MAGPWEKYQSQGETTPGPWQKYQEQPASNPLVPEENEAVDLTSGLPMRTATQMPGVQATADLGRGALKGTTETFGGAGQGLLYLGTLSGLVPKDFYSKYTDVVNHATRSMTTDGDGFSVGVGEFAGSVLPYFLAPETALAKIPGLFGRALEGAAQGSIIGATQFDPERDPDKRDFFSNVLTGAGIGAVLSPLGRVGQRLVQKLDARKLVGQAVDYLSGAQKAMSDYAEEFRSGAISNVKSAYKAVDNLYEKMSSAGDKAGKVDSSQLWAKLGPEIATARSKVGEMLSPETKRIFDETERRFAGNEPERSSTTTARVQYDSEGKRIRRTEKSEVTDRTPDQTTRSAITETTGRKSFGRTVEKSTTLTGEPRAPDATYRDVVQMQRYYRDEVAKLEKDESERAREALPYVKKVADELDSAVDSFENGSVLSRKGRAQSETFRWRQQLQAREKELNELDTAGLGSLLRDPRATSTDFLNATLKIAKGDDLEKSKKLVGLLGEQGKQPIAMAIVKDAVDRSLTEQGAIALDEVVKNLSKLPDGTKPFLEGELGDLVKGWSNFVRDARTTRRSVGGHFVGTLSLYEGLRHALMGSPLTGAGIAGSGAAAAHLFNSFRQLSQTQAGRNLLVANSKATPGSREAQRLARLASQMLVRGGTAATLHESQSPTLLPDDEQ